MWSGWSDGGGPACYLLPDPDHLQNPIRSFPRVSLESVSEFMARVQGAREEHDRSGRTVERLFNCNRRLAKDVEATS